MRYRLGLIFILVFLVTALVQAQGPVADRPAPPGQMVTGLWQPDPNAQPPAAPLAPVGPTFADAASDACDAAPPLDLGRPGGDGGQTVVNSMTESVDDPTLDRCMWGSPTSLQGHRSVWYKVIAPISGILYVEANPNVNFHDNYDTVIAIHSGSCGGLTTLTCTDDTNGFLSQASAFVTAGETYYVEVVDWQFPVNGAAILNLTAKIESITGTWTEVSTIPIPRSRHAVVAVDGYIYVIGGQTAVGATPTRTSAVSRYDIANDQWTEMAPILGPDGNGYSNMDAAYINGKIYVPTGWVGDVDEYDGTFWAYDINANEWYIEPDQPGDDVTPWPGGVPLGYTTLVESDPGLNGFFLLGGVHGHPFSSDNLAYGTVLFFKQGIGGLSDNWQIVGDEMNTPRYMHTGVRLPDGRICVAAGLTTGAAPLDSAECYPPGGGNWQNIASLNIPRFDAGSVIGPDGRWYVFGGYNNTFGAIPDVEVYDTGSNTWQVLPDAYDITEPQRAHVRGVTAADRIWLVGGETATGEVVPLLEALRVVANLNLATYFPVVPREGDGVEPNDTLSQAVYLPLDTWGFQRFIDRDDKFDMWEIQLTETHAMRMRLQWVPEGADFELLLYDDNKTLLGISENPGNADEDIYITLGPGTYYLMVVRDLPVGDPPPPPQVYRVRAAIQD